MKRILLLGVLMFSGLVFGQSGAKIEFKNDVVDYGEVSKDSNGVRSFLFTNTGDAPLIISNVNSTCGCIVITKPTEAILAGKSGTIEVKYNMALGTIRKTITVESNAVNYEDGIVKLSLKGEVK